MYKNDDPEEPNNYHPISITPFRSKIFETILGIKPVSTLTTTTYHVKIYMV